jgi:hypothetical protein
MKTSLHLWQYLASLILSLSLSLTHTHTQLYSTHCFPRQNGFREHSSMLRYTYIVCLVIMKMECVYCAVGTRYSCCSSRLFLAHAPSSRPTTAKSLVPSHANPCEFCGQTLPPVPLFSPVQYHSSNSQNSSRPTSCSYQNDKPAKPEILTKKQRSLWSWPAVARKVLSRDVKG